MKTLFTFLIISLSVVLSLAQISIADFEVEGNVIIDDSVSIARSNIELYNFTSGSSRPKRYSGALFLYDTDGLIKNRVRTKRIELRANNSSLDINPSLKLYNSNAETLLSLQTNDDFGGNLDLSNDQGEVQVSIRGMESTGDGGQIVLNNAEQIETIEIDGDSNGDSGLIKIKDANGNNRVVIYGSEKNDATENGSAIYLYDRFNRKTLELDADIDGYSRVICNEFQLNGGADLAENFDILSSKNIVPQPGMLVSIDPASTGKLLITQTAYDYRIAGIISGANGIKPGIYMGQEGTIADGDFPVALTGRAYVFANNQNGTIAPGDLLTSADQPGYAMKADTQNQNLNGVIIGKALTKLEGKTGYVLVLVNLQ